MRPPLSPAAEYIAPQAFLPPPRHDSDNLIAPSFYFSVDEIVYRVLEIIDAHLSGHITLREMSRTLMISESGLQKVFRARTGFTVGRYRKIKRIEKAKNLLMADPERPMQDICLDVGYADESSLRREFRKTTGISLQSFKKSVMLNNQPIEKIV